MKTFALACLVLSVLVGCFPIEPKDECAGAANDCDQALEQPFNSFIDTDQTFGVAGTCWANEETAKACVAECDKFVAEQLALAKDRNDIGAIEACGGSVE